MSVLAQGFLSKFDDLQARMRDGNYVVRVLSILIIDSFIAHCTLTPGQIDTRCNHL